NPLRGEALYQAGALDRAEAVGDPPCTQFVQDLRDAVRPASLAGMADDRQAGRLDDLRMRPKTPQISRFDETCRAESGDAFAGMRGCDPGKVLGNVEIVVRIDREQPSDLDPGVMGRFGKGSQDGPRDLVERAQAGRINIRLDRRLQID